jgi:hypothetical protein
MFLVVALFGVTVGCGRLLSARDHTFVRSAIYNQALPLQNNESLADGTNVARKNRCI